MSFEEDLEQVRQIIHREPKSISGKLYDVTLGNIYRGLENLFAGTPLDVRNVEEGLKQMYGESADIPAGFARGISLGAISPKIETPEDAGVAHRIAASAAELMGASPYFALAGGVLGSLGIAGGAGLLSSAAREGLTFAVYEALRKAENPDEKLAEIAKSGGIGAITGAGSSMLGRVLEKVFPKYKEIVAKEQLINQLRETKGEGVDIKSLPDTIKITPEEAKYKHLIDSLKSATIGAGFGLAQPHEDARDMLIDAIVGGGAFGLTHAVTTPLAKGEELDITKFKEKLQEQTKAQEQTKEQGQTAEQGQAAKQEQVAPEQEQAAKQEQPIKQEVEQLHIPFVEEQFKPQVLTQGILVEPKAETKPVINEAQLNLFKYAEEMQKPFDLTQQKPIEGFMQDRKGLPSAEREALPYIIQAPDLTDKTRLKEILDIAAKIDKGITISSEENRKLLEFFKEESIPAEYGIQPKQLRLPLGIEIQEQLLRPTENIEPEQPSPVTSETQLNLFERPEILKTLEQIPETATQQLKAPKPEKATKEKIQEQAAGATTAETPKVGEKPTTLTAYSPSVREYLYALSGRNAETFRKKFYRPVSKAVKEASKKTGYNYDYSYILDQLQVKDIPIVRDKAEAESRFGGNYIPIAETSRGLMVVPYDMLPKYKAAPPVKTEIPVLSVKETKDLIKQVGNAIGKASKGIEELNTISNKDVNAKGNILQDIRKIKSEERAKWKEVVAYLNFIEDVSNLKLPSGLKRLLKERRADLVEELYGKLPPVSKLAKKQGVVGKVFAEAEGKRFQELSDAEKVKQIKRGLETIREENSQRILASVFNINLKSAKDRLSKLSDTEREFVYNLATNPALQKSLGAEGGVRVLPVKEIRRVVNRLAQVEKEGGKLSKEEQDFLEKYRTLKTTKARTIKVTEEPSDTELMMLAEEIASEKGISKEDAFKELKAMAKDFGLGKDIKYSIEDITAKTREPEIAAIAHLMDIIKDRATLRFVAPEEFLKDISEEALKAHNLTRADIEKGLFRIVGKTTITEISPTDIRTSIEISLAAPDKVRSLAHERMHTIERMLEALNEKDTLDVLRATYKDTEQLADAFADYYTNFIRGNRTDITLTSTIRSAFNKLVAFFVRLKNWASGRGWTSAEDIFKEIVGGKYSEVEAPTQTAGEFASVEKPKISALSDILHPYVKDKAYTALHDALINLHDSTKLKQSLDNLRDVIVKTDDFTSLKNPQILSVLKNVKPSFFQNKVLSSWKDVVSSIAQGSENDFTKAFSRFKEALSESRLLFEIPKAPKEIVEGLVKGEDITDIFRRYSRVENPETLKEAIKSEVFEKRQESLRSTPAFNSLLKTIDALAEYVKTPTPEKKLIVDVANKDLQHSIQTAKDNTIWYSVEKNVKDIFQLFKDYIKTHKDEFKKDDIGIFERYLSIPLSQARNYPKFNKFLEIALNYGKTKSLLQVQLNKDPKSTLENPDTHIIYKIHKGFLTRGGRIELMRRIYYVADKYNLKLEKVDDWNKLTESEKEVLTSLRDSFRQSGLTLVNGIEKSLYEIYKDKEWGKLLPILTSEQLLKSARKVAEAVRGWSYLPKEERPALANYIRERANDMPEEIFNLKDKEIQDVFRAVLSISSQVENLRKMRSVIENINTYMPHFREQGSWRVVAYSGTVVSKEQEIPKMQFMKMFKDNPIGKAKALRVKRALEKSGKYDSVKIEYQSPNPYASVLPDALDVKILLSHLSKELEAKKTITKEEVERIKEGAIISSIQQLINNIEKTLGFSGQRFEKRANILGYKDTRLDEIFRDYNAGVAGTLAKLSASHEFVKALSEINIKTEPQLYSLAKNYMTEIIAPSKTADKFVTSLRSVAFTYMLGANAKSALIQLSQNFIVGIPELNKIMKRYKVNGSAVGAYTTAMKDITKSKIGRGTAHLNREEKRALQRAINEGVVEAKNVKFITELTEGGRPMRQLINVMGYGFEKAEEFNRASAFLAAYRVYRKARLTSEQAYKNAENYVNTVHFVFGRANLPELARGSGILPTAVKVGYTFANYPHNLVMYLIDNLRKQPDGTRNLKTFFHSLAWLSAFGGLTAIPFIDSILDAAEQNLGVNFRAQAYKKLQKYGIGDVALRGLPTIIGADFSGSLRIDLPLIRLFTTEPRLEETMFGVYSGILRKLGEAKEAFESGSTYRTIEHASPVAIENAMKALRESGMLEKYGIKGGATYASGKPVISLTGEKYKPTQGETILRLLSIQGSERSKISLANRIMKNLQNYYADKKEEILTDYRNAITIEDRRRVVDRIKKFNREIKSLQGVVSPITLTSLQRAKAVRVKPIKAFSKKFFTAQ